MKVTIKSGGKSLKFDTRKKYRSSESGIDDANQVVQDQTQEYQSNPEVTDGTQDSSDSESDMSSMFGDDFFGEDTQGVEETPQGISSLTEEENQQLEAEIEKEKAVAQNNQSNNATSQEVLSTSQVESEIAQYTDNNERTAIEKAYIDIQKSGSNSERMLFDEVNKRERISRAIAKGYNPNSNPSRMEYVMNVLQSVQYNAKKAMDALNKKGVADKKVLNGFEVFGIPVGTLASKVLSAMINGINGGHPLPIGESLAITVDAGTTTNSDNSKNTSPTNYDNKNNDDNGTVESKNNGRNFQVSKQQLAIGAGGAALAIIAAKLLGGTIYNHVTSIGNFKSGDEMIHSRTLEQKVNQLVKKYPNHPTIEKVKQDPRARSKSTFLGWLLGGSSNAKVINNIKSANMLIKGVSGVPVSVTSITPMTFNTNKILIATAYFEKEDGSIISVPLARGFLSKGYVVNYSKECSDIYFGMNNSRFDKKTNYESCY